MYQLKKVYLEITNVCNLRCDFCPGTRRPQGFLSPEDFSVLAQKLRPHTEYLYLHLMGEPLLHPQLPKLLDIAAGLGFQVNLTTNGTLLPQRASLLCQSPAVRKVSVSLHSFEGNEGQGQLLPYLDGCIAFARQAAQAGKRCALRLWNLDGETTQGANSCNDVILRRLEETFPRPWKEGWQGTTLAPRVYLEWGERFEWPDLNADDQGQSGFCQGLRDHVGLLGQHIRDLALALVAPVGAHNSFYHICYLRRPGFATAVRICLIRRITQRIHYTAFFLC